MTKELDRLEKAFRTQAETNPRDNAKTDTIAAAMKAFEQEKISSASQETENDARHTGQGGEQSTLSIWRRIMNTINSKWAYSLAGSASIAVLALVMVGPNVGDLITVPVPEKPDLGLTSNEEKDEVFRSEPRQVLEREQAKTNEEIGRVTPAESRDEAAPSNAPQAQSELQGRNDMSVVAPSISKSAAKKKSVPSSGALLAERSREGYVSQAAPVPDDANTRHYQDQGRDKFEEIVTNPVKLVSEEPVSTFSVDVDTASYAFTRASLNNNILPQKDAVRVEELINYFDYGYEAPADKSEPFKANVEIMPTPWNSGTKLMSIGIMGYELPKEERPASNLVFLLDTSGSMNAPNKLPLLRNSFKLLLSSLKPDDTVSIVTYAGSAGTVLEPTKAADKNRILAALDNLHAGGSTAGAEGIRQAYALAEGNLKKDGVNRVILATDGDFNVGIQNPEELKSYVERKRKTGVTLSVLGFGQGNYNDQLMQTLAQNGNGNASYIDTLSEARKVLVEEVGSTLFTIAKDVKLQVEFNPALVSEYRLIGYETRALKREDFNNDKVDAGDIGAGHTVTALYEITPADSNARLVDDLRYSGNKKAPQSEERSADNEEYGFLKIRYKLPKEDESQLITRRLSVDDEVASARNASIDSRFAASVAAFGQVLRGGQYTGSYTYDDVVSLAQSAKGKDEFGYRAEFINLVRLAQTAAALQPLKQ